MQTRREMIRNGALAAVGGLIGCSKDPAELLLARERAFSEDRGRSRKLPVTLDQKLQYASTLAEMAEALLFNGEDRLPTPGGVQELYLVEYRFNNAPVAQMLASDREIDTSLESYVSGTRAALERMNELPYKSLTSFVNGEVYEGGAVASLPSGSDLAGNNLWLVAPSATPEDLGREVMRNVLDVRGIRLDHSLLQLGPVLAHRCNELFYGGQPMAEEDVRGLYRKLETLAE